MPDLIARNRKANGRCPECGAPALRGHLRGCGASLNEPDPLAFAGARIESWPDQRVHAKAVLARPVRHCACLDGGGAPCAGHYALCPLRLDLFARPSGWPRFPLASSPA